MPTDRGGVGRWLALAAAVGALDQVSKLAATAWLTYNVPLPVVPGFNLTLLHNTGAAFSLLNQAGGWQRWFFTGIAVVVVVAVVWWLARLDRAHRWDAWAFSLILGGAVGNLVDRLRLGYVVDFIQVYYRDWYWPAFNIADSAIFVGAGMLIIHSKSFAVSRPVHG